LVTGRSLAELTLQRAAYSVAHVVVANARAAADRLRREGVPERKVSTVANGLDLSLYTPSPPRSSIRRILVVANLRSEKGHDVLIDAAPHVLRQYPDARFEIVGGGPERASLAGRAHARGVSHAFDFAGHCDNIAARLSSADLFVLPSRSEAFPNALLEAMAAGLPAVASAVGGILELVESERTGVLVPQDDPAALAAALCRVMDNPDFAARIGAAARARVQAGYSFDRMVAGFESLYLSGLARRGVLTEEPLFTEYSSKGIAR
jgi:glycosyltransferase involved in cell wall biosynthesis